MLYINNPYTDAWFNLAAEEYLLKNFSDDIFMLWQNEPSVIIARRPCVLLKYVKHAPPFVIDDEKCKKCKACMRIGCPAISITDGRVVIDDTLCVGCDLCTKLCSFGAIKSSEVHV